MNESEWLDRLRSARAGERAALSDVARDLHAALEHAARGMVGDRLRARIRLSDIVQSVLIEALQTMDEFRGQTQAEFSEWTRRILENRIRDKRRYFAAGKRSASAEDAAADPSRAAGPTATPSRIAAASDDLAQVSAAMSRLPTDRRRILLLVAMQGLSHRQAAEHMGRSPEACRVLLARARASLTCELARMRKADSA